MKHIILRTLTGKKYILLGTVVKNKETIVLVGDLETGELFEERLKGEKNVRF